MPHFDLTLTGDSSLSLRTFSVREAVSQLFEVSIVALSRDADVDLATIVGQPAQFVASSGVLHLAGRHRSWKGVVSYIEQIQVETLSQVGQSTYSLIIVPPLWLLTQRRNYRIYQHLSVPQIVDALLAEWQIEHAWTLVGTYDKLEYKVQYGESDYAFLCRLLEEAGIAFTFPDHAPIDMGAVVEGFVGVENQGWSGGSLLTFGDDLTSGRLYESAPIDFVDEPNMAAQREFVTELQLSHGVRPGAYTLRDHDFRKPSFPLLAGAPAAPAPESRYEQYHYQPGAFVVEGGAGGGTPVADDKSVARHQMPVGTAQATRRLVAERQGKRQVSFATNVFGLEPGLLITVAHHPQAELDPANQLLVVELTTSGGYSVEWRTQARGTFAADKYRPPLSTPKPEAQGVQSATVVGPPGEEIYTDEFGRARVQFPWDRQGQSDDDSSCWMRVSQGWAGTGFGAIDVPRVGQEVLVGFLGGDPDQPIIVGRVFNATSQVPYKLPDHKSRSTWKSNTYPGGGGFNELMFEDAKDQELVYVQAQKNLRRLVKNDETVTIGRDRQGLVKGNAVEEIRGDEQLLIGGNRDLVIKADRRELVGGDGDLHVRGDHVVRVGGDDALVVSGQVHVKAGAAIVVEGSDVTIKGAGGFIRIDAMGVTIVGLLVNINSGGTAGTVTGRTDVHDAGDAAPDDVSVTGLGQ